MYDDYYSRLIAREKMFIPQEGNAVIEIFDDDYPGGRLVYEKHLEDDDIPSWLANCDSKRPPLLQLFLCSPETHNSDAEILPLPISRGSLESIMTSWHLPTEFLRMLLSTMPISANFTVKDEQSPSVLEGLMLRSGRSRDWNYCLAIIHDKANGSTHCIVHGLEEKESTKLKECLSVSLELAHHPMLLPILLVELKIHEFAVLLEKRAAGLEKIEYETGMRHGFSQNPAHRNKSREDRAKDRASLDFDLITQKLTGLAGTFAFCELTFQAGIRSLDLIEAFAKKTALDLPQPLYQRIVYLRGLIAGAQDTRGLLEQRTKSQVQTVYSLIGQKDAEASLRDSKAMKTIAEETKAVTILTQRDSTNMRIITAITLIFLPGTFIATFFSTEFFNFSDGGSSIIVSPWIWVYWLVTVLLTAFVLVVWVIMSNYQYRRTRHLVSNFEMV